MKNKSLARSRNVIPYIKDYRILTGSVTATILIVQLDYWFDKYPDGFYKFLSKPENNPAYKDGDSWTEELGFSEDEFRTAFDKIGIRYKSKKEYNISTDKFNGKYYCSYHDKIRGTTHYFRNHDLLDKHLDDITLSDIRKTKKLTPVNRVNQSTEIGNPNPEYTETTQRLPDTTQTNQAQPEPAQNLTNELKEIFDKANINLTGKKLSWAGKEKEYGRNLQLIIKAAENDFVEIKKRAAKFYELVKTDDWYKKNGFTPSSFLSNWNKLAEIKKDARGLETKEKTFPDWQNMSEAEIEKTFNNPDFPFQTHEILPHLPEKVQHIWKSKGFYFYGLAEILIKYKRGEYV